MSSQDDFWTVCRELEAGIQLPKCQKCGCMGDMLKHLTTVLSSIHTPDAMTLRQNVSSWLEHRHPIQYPCLECEQCYPAVAHNALAHA